MKQPEIIVKKVSELLEWDRNPRSIMGERYEQLKKSIKQNGFNDVLKLAADGQTVIGGNHRLKALRELEINEVPCIITDAQTNRQIFEYALRDNEAFAYYEKEEVAELAIELNIEPVELQTFDINLGKNNVSLLDIVNDLGPDNKQRRELVECPTCHSHVPAEQIEPVVQADG